jgi:hypothetical protein
MASRKTPTTRWQLLTRRLELRARWTAFCAEAAQRSDAPPARPAGRGARAAKPSTGSGPGPASPFAAEPTAGG